MAVGDELPECSTTTAPPPSPSPESSHIHRSCGAPVSLLVMLHGAFRRELNELKRVVGEAYGGACGALERRMKLVELVKRVEFLRSVYKYHCVAEAEVIFLALDARVENIACTYYLQHSSTDSMFEAIVTNLNCIVDKLANSTQELQEVTFQIGTLRDSICQHMAKEEKQVFPLLVKNFSAEEQASLVWQFMCNFPVMLLEDLFPWLASSLSPEEQLDLKNCVNNILTEECTLKELLISWIDKVGQQSSDSFNNYDRSSKYSQERDDLRELSNLCLLKKSSNERQDFDITENGPFHGLLLWHAAIRSDFQEILSTLNQATLKKMSGLTSLIVQIKFLNEVLIYYSNMLEKFFYPLLEDGSLLQTSTLNKLFLHKNEVGGLQKFLYDAIEVNLTESTFLAELCSKVETVVLVTTEHLSIQETEVFPRISKICNHESQQKLLIRSLCILPLGLLKCVVTWFSSHLPKDMLNAVLNSIEQSIILNKPFALLLHEWVRSGYSGKTSRENLQEMFNRTMPFTFDVNKKGEDPCTKLKQENLNSVGSSKKFFRHSASRTNGTDLLMFSSGGTSMVDPLSGYPTQGVTNNFLEPRPMDHVYYFHKAIKKDLESLVLDAPKLSKNLGHLTEFTQHFQFVRSLYELHSETEDKVAFPALETHPNAHNLTQSYSIDHEMQAECFNRVSGILNEMSTLYHTLSRTHPDSVDPALRKYHLLCLQLQDSCKSLKKILEDHILREETQLWPLFREYFTIEEQVKILGYMLGRTRAQILQEMIEWLMAHLTLDEQQAMMNYWHKATYCTKFNEWLGEWWEGVNKYDLDESEEVIVYPSLVNVNVVSKYPCRDGSLDWRDTPSAAKSASLNSDSKAAANVAKKMDCMDFDPKKHNSLENARVYKKKKDKVKKEEHIDVHSKLSRPAQEVYPQTKHLAISPDESAAATKMMLHDSWLDLQAKSRANQSMVTSQCFEAKSYSDSGQVITCEPGKLQGQFPSYRDIEGSVFGCRHYKQNCKLVAPCCNRIVTCRRCHEEEISDHVMERKSITQMMCMKCLKIQPIGRICSTPSCNEYSMAKYYCRICRLFDDEREIYHCPYCNLCRVGKGLGIDYFHCMKCNACMGRSLLVHKCIEKCIEDKCPICQEEMFTSTNPVKSLNCGHVMHSTCFQDYTCMKYTCPICSKSLGDMQVYFKMLDALLAEEMMPEEYSGQTRAILCNDCSMKGTAPFHWLYHKCPSCGSYNTRIL
ncbi:hypothetical protein vseg_003086 [Gypsophila vaccaria]